MTDFILIEDKELYRLLAERYLLIYFDVVKTNDSDVIEEIDFQENINLFPTYFKYGFTAWLESFGEYLAIEQHMKRVYDTIPTDGAKFYFEREENEGKRDYINRLINNAQFDRSAKIMGKFKHGKHEIWFNVRPEDTYEIILADIEECLSSWEDIE